jgi:hypothetical protein
MPIFSTSGEFGRESGVGATQGQLLGLREGGDSGDGPQCRRRVEYLKPEH